VVAVSVSQRIASDDQLARLLQIGIVLEEVVEARAHHHYQSLSTPNSTTRSRRCSPTPPRSRPNTASERLESLIEGLGVDSVPFDEIESLVDARYGRTRPEDFDGVLYDQLCNEERPPTSSTTTSSMRSKTQTPSSRSTARNFSTSCTRSARTRPRGQRGDGGHGATMNRGSNRRRAPTEGSRETLQTSTSRRYTSYRSRKTVPPRPGRSPTPSASVPRAPTR